MLSLEEYQKDIYVLFEVVDYCYKITILGGEPLLNKDFPNMLQWLHDNYKNKIGTIEIVTNGTIVPSELLLEKMRAVQAEVKISDYSLNALYKNKLEIIESTLVREGIPFSISHEMKWKDFYFPRKEQGVNYTSIRKHMLCCNPVFRGLNERKFYYCHIVWSAVKAGIWEEQDGDCIKLEEIHSDKDRGKLLAHDLGYFDKGYISLCKVCGGCSIDNKCIIEAGVQE